MFYHGNEVKIVALFTTLILFPQPGDFCRHKQQNKVFTYIYNISYCPTQVSLGHVTFYGGKN
jgi:hypothetical protein